MKALLGEGQAVTYASIREKVHALSGLWISANTIKRNDLAYPIYMEHRQPPKSRRRREPLLMRLLAAVPGDERRAAQSKVARLRREPKDALIASSSFSTRPWQSRSGRKTRSAKRLFVSTRQKLGARK